MKKTLFMMAMLLMGTITFEAKADLFNIGGVRTKVYSFSNKSFDGAEQEVRTMPEVNEIVNSGPLNVVYVESQESKVVIQGDKDLFCRVQTQYKNGAVNISLESGTYRNLWLQVVVYAPKINSIKCTGSGNVKADKVTCNAPEMNLKVTGSAVISIQELICKNGLDIHITGSGDVRTTQMSCSSLDVNITGSGDLMAKETTCTTVETTVSGSGGAKFESIKAEVASLSVTGSGDVRLLDGSITTIKARITGSGQVLGSLKYNAIDQRVTGSGTIRINQK